MYLPLIFQEQDRGKLLALMQAYPLATLISTDKEGMAQADVLPFWVSHDVEDVDDEVSLDKVRLLTHIARANPLCEYIDGQEVMVLFYGENGYISPNYYPSKFVHHRHVPTWNYQVVQVRGRVQVFEDSKSLMALLGHLTNMHEATQETPWRMKDAPKEYLKEELAHIVGLTIEPVEMVGKFKLSQNRTPEDLQGVVNGLAQHHAPLAQAVKDAYKG